jgi:hypothetical protein
MDGADRAKAKYGDAIILADLALRRRIGEGE